MSETEDQELKIYELTNLNTGEKQFSVSNNAQDACKQAGCIVGDCFVREVKPELRPRGDGHSVLMVKIPCRVCPYQFGECIRPVTGLCPVRTETPDILEWARQAALAHLCQHTGKALTRKDYNLYQKWCPMEQAIAELAHRS